MHSSLRTAARRAVTVAAAMLLTAALAGPASAAPWSATFPDGVACEGFDLIVDGMGTGHGLVQRQFDGGMVITAGAGDTLTFTNGTTRASLSLRSNGAGSITRPGPGDLSTVTSFGHNVLILFPTDVPAGPSTTLYVGRVVYTLDASYNFTMLGSAGTATDICAALG